MFELLKFLFTCESLVRVCFLFDPADLRVVQEFEFSSTLSDIICSCFTLALNRIIFKKVTSLKEGCFFYEISDLNLNNLTVCEFQHSC